MKRLSEVRSYLKKVPLFAELAPGALSLIGAIGRVQHCGKGAVIFGEDDPRDRLYIVLAGRVKIFAGNGTRKKTLAYLEKDEFFGEMSLLDREPRSASSVALEDSDLLVIRKKDFRALLERNPRIAVEVMRTLSRRLRQADREIEALTFGDVLGRLAATLLDLAERYGKKDTANVRITMLLSHRELAELAGTGREVVSRLMNRLKRMGCVTYAQGYITLTDVAKLKRFV